MPEDFTSPPSNTHSQTSREYWVEQMDGYWDGVGIIGCKALSWFVALYLNKCSLYNYSGCRRRKGYSAMSVKFKFVNIVFALPLSYSHNSKNSYRLYCVKGVNSIQWLSAFPQICLWFCDKFRNTYYAINIDIILQIWHLIKKVKQKKNKKQKAKQTY